MRGTVRFPALLCFTALLCACSGPGPQSAQVPAGEHYRITKDASWNGSLKDLASQTAANIVLKYRGAKLLRADPFPACTGEAGLQTFTLPGKGGAAQILRVAFTQWSGPAVTVIYERPRSSPDSKEAVDAMTRSLCTSGAPAKPLPPAR